MSGGASGLGPRGRVVDVELDAPRLAFALLVAAAVLGAAFWLGRWSAGGAGRAAGEGAFAPAEREGAALVEEGAVDDVTASETLFDRLGEGGGRRASEWQVASERVAQGAYEVDLGVTRSRAEAERWLAAVESSGLSGAITGVAGGGYRVAAGPFDDEDRARAARRSIEAATGRKATVRRTDGS